MPKVKLVDHEKTVGDVWDLRGPAKQPRNAHRIGPNLWPNGERQYLDRDGVLIPQEPAKGPIEGEVGIEIEVEGAGLPPRPSKWWKGEADGSLRGESLEYVLREPVKREEVRTALDFLDEKIKEAKAKLNMSYRTSVHVHINVQKLKMRELWSFVSLYMTLEDLLVEHSGETRVGNLFCLRANDAEHMVHLAADAIRMGDYRELGRDGMRYSALNLVALSKFNSLEFRSFRGTTDPTMIANWTDILLAIKDTAVQFNNPRDLMAEFSAQGPLEFIHHVFKGRRDLLQPLVTLKNFEKRMYEGVRLAQDIAYATDWEAKTTAKTVNPFDHNPVGAEPPMARYEDILREIRAAPPRRAEIPAWGERPFVRGLPDRLQADGEDLDGRPTYLGFGVHGFNERRNLEAQWRTVPALDITGRIPTYPNPEYVVEHFVWDVINNEPFGMDVTEHDQVVPHPGWFWNNLINRWQENFVPGSAEWYGDGDEDDEEEEEEF